MAAPHPHEKDPLDPAVLTAVMADDARERREAAQNEQALERNPHRHGTIIRLVAGVLLVAALYLIWLLVSTTA